MPCDICLLAVFFIVPAFCFRRVSPSAGFTTCACKLSNSSSSSRTAIAVAVTETDCNSVGLYHASIIGELFVSCNCSHELENAMNVTSTAAVRSLEQSIHKVLQPPSRGGAVICLCGQPDTGIQRISRSAARYATCRLTVCILM